jgi:hypothetical protein
LHGEEKNDPRIFLAGCDFVLLISLEFISRKYRKWKKAVAGIMAKDNSAVVVQQLMSPKCGHAAAGAGYFAGRCRFEVVVPIDTMLPGTRLGAGREETVGCQVARPSVRDRGSPIPLLVSRFTSWPAGCNSKSCPAELGVAVSLHIIFLLQAQQVKVPSITPKLRVRFRESHQSQYHS